MKNLRASQVTAKKCLPSTRWRNWKSFEQNFFSQDFIAEQKKLWQPKLWEFGKCLGSMKKVLWFGDNLGQTEVMGKTGRQSGEKKKNLRASLDFKAFH